MHGTPEDFDDSTSLAVRRYRTARRECEAALLASPLELDTERMHSPIAMFARAAQRLHVAVSILLMDVKVIVVGLPGFEVWTAFERGAAIRAAVIIASEEYAAAESEAHA